MSTTPSDSDDISGEWQEEAIEKRRSRLGLYTWRAIVTLLFSLAVAFFIYYLFPWGRPYAHVVVLRASGQRILHGPVLPVAGRELELFDPLGDGNVATFHRPNEIDSMFKTPEALKGLSASLKDLRIDRRDALILYVAANGITYHGDAYLVCDNFDPDDPLDGLCEIGNLLGAVHEFPARVKMLILDAGQYDYDPRLGILVNDFPRMLETAVRGIEDANLFVLCSHSSLEHSYRSHALAGSVFGTMVAKGLLGAADRNLDGNIEPEELSTFVADKVSAWVQQSTNDGSTQTPQLFRGSGLPGSSPVFLVRAAQKKAGGSDLDISSLVRSRPAESAERGGPAAIAAPRSGFLARVAGRDTAAGVSSSATGGDGSAASHGSSVPAGSAASASGEANEGASARAEREFRAEIESAWQIRDELAQPVDVSNADQLRPVDATPHLWRAAQEELNDYEQYLQGEDRSADVMLTDSLKTALSKFQVEQDKKQVLVRDFLKLPGGAPAGAAPQAPIDWKAFRSLALARLIAKETSVAPPTQVDELQLVLDGLINVYPDELPAKIAELKYSPDFDRFYELRLIKQLAGVGGIKPALVQLALQTRRDGEQEATGAIWCSGWLDADVAAGDRSRLAGERRMLDQIGPDWADQAQRSLERARDRYAQAAKTRQEVRRAITLRNDLAFRAPYYVRYQHLSAPGTADSDGVLTSYLTDLIEFSYLLDHPSSSSIAKIPTLRAKLEKGDSKLGTQFSDKSIQSLTNAQENGRAWQVSQLLASPLPSAAAHGDLLEAARSFDAESAKRFKWEFQKKAVASPYNQLQQCRLELLLAQLADGRVQAVEPQSVTPILPSLSDDDALSVLLHAFGEFEKSCSPGKAVGQTVVDDQLVWSNMQSFGVALKAFYDTLPKRIRNARRLQSGQSIADIYQAVAQAQRALQLLDARDSGKFHDLKLADLTRDLDLHNTLVWHQQRFTRAEADAPRDEVEYLGEAANQYAAQAMRVLRPESSVAVTVPEVELVVRRIKSLVSERKGEIDATVSYVGAGDAEMWVVVQYDKRLLKVIADATPNIVDTNQHDRRLAIEGPYRPDLAGLPPTLPSLHSGDSAVVRLSVDSETSGIDSAPLIVKAIAVPVKGQGNGAVSYVRQRIEVPLRAIQVVVDAPQNSWRQAGERLVLHSFPNRVTNYGFGVRNYGATDREVSLRFFAPESRVDLASLEVTEIEQLVNKLKPIGQLTVPAPADGKTHIAAAAEAKKQAAAAAEAKSAAPAPPPPKADEATKPPTGPTVPFGLLVEVSDPKDPLQKYVEQIDILPQRPRRYVQPKVGYNSERERIEVSVKPPAGLVSLLPPGPVEVKCEIADEPPGVTGGKLRDVLAPPNYEANLFVNIPAAVLRVVTLYLHVDGYPRAFIYQVPCGAHDVNLPEETDLADLRIRKVTWPDFQPPAAATPVEVQVDSPVGTFETGRDSLNVALDENMDKHLGPEPGVRYGTDRQADAYLQALGEDGVLALDTRVSDHNVALLTDRLQNVEVQVNGAFSAAGGAAGAIPVTLKIDGAAPQVQLLEVSPGFGVVAGTDLNISVLTVDTMSGVKKVEVGFDVDGTGAFSEKLAPVLAVLDPQTTSFDPQKNALTPAKSSLAGPELHRGQPSRWVAKLPTKDILGIQTVLVRATDRVGNASEYYGKRVQILTAEQAAAKIQQQAKSIEGTVVFRDRPVPGAELKLVGPDAKEIATVKAGDSGNYSLVAVPPGKYALSAQGVINNVPRFGLLDIVVEPAPGRVVRADVSVK